MKTMIAAATIAASFASAAIADQPLTDWQEKALTTVTEYKRVKTAQWQSETLLWLFADKADVTWDNIADQVSCNHLRAAGMPKGSRIMVAFYDDAAAKNGKAEKMGYALCK